MNEQQKKRQVAKISVFITSIFVIFMSVTYAFITQTLTGTKKVTITAGTLSLVLDEKNEITISDALPMYDQVGMIQDKVFVFDLINNTANDTDYVLKLQKVSTSNELSESDVKYYLTKEGVGTPALLSSLTNGVIDEGTIAGGDTINYSLRLWIRDGVTDQTTIAGKSLSYKLVVEASMSEDVTLASNAVTTKLFEEDNLEDDCKTYDDGVDTFLVGNCKNNYVWYSGKLWRVVLKNNETGAVKMVTDNAITAIPYNASGNTAFEDSYMDQWLNQEFLPTLHDYEDYLVVNSIWDATENSSDTPSRPSYTTTVTRTVGLLNSYEYYASYAYSDLVATSDSNGNPTRYLDARVSWWLMTPYDTSNMRYVDYGGLLLSYTPSEGYGVRPSVNLKSTIQISGGSGIQSDPYILEGDIKEPANGTTLLNTRYSGEYITFNNELYRIVNIENGLTKITSVDNPSALSSNQFHSNYGAASSTFDNVSIKTDLENYYQGLKTTNEVAYNMIQQNTTWYLGKLERTTNYKATICATVDANTSMNSCVSKALSTQTNIGLPRVGEMFTSQINRGTKANFWTLTTNGSGGAWMVYNDGNLYDYNFTHARGARPSMYLKSNVVIAKNNTGNGTYEHPYSLSMN